MTSFSDRHGLSRTALQTDSMDNELRTGLWNAFYRFYANEIRYVFYDRNFGFFIEGLWADVLKRPLNDIIVRYPERFLNEVYDWIHLRAPWNRVYDLIEFLPSNYPLEPLTSNFRAEVNRVLERECAGYRFVSDKLVRITAEEEI